MVYNTFRAFRKQLGGIRGQLIDGHCRGRFCHGSLQGPLNVRLMSFSADDFTTRNQLTEWPWRCNPSRIFNPTIP